MPRRVLHVHHAEGSALRDDVAAIQSDLGLSPVFPAQVEQAAAVAAKNPRLPELDRTDLPLVTIDPPGARDLDQALHIAREGDGYVVSYAIADVAAFVKPGDPVDLESRERGESMYAADMKVPLHPRVLSEDAASLLPGETRPALLWTIRVDAEGEGLDADVRRALVRSRAQLDYAQVQRALDDGTADESLVLLAEVGQLRQRQESVRGGISLPLPDQEVDIHGDRWTTSFRSSLPVEEWNAQISLLTGMGAADLMIYAGVGILRTLPPPQPRDLQRLHRTAAALGIPWPAEQLYPDFIRSLDTADPAHAAMVVASTRLLRGAGYLAFDGAVPGQPVHAALASEYAHVTAPLRRLVDRYALEVCAALCADREVPDWVRERLEELPGVMQRSGSLAGRYESAVLNLVEAAILMPHVGETFAAVVVAVDQDDSRSADIVIKQPAIEARMTATEELSPGAEMTVRLVQADPAARTVRFEPA